MNKLKKWFFKKLTSIDLQEFINNQLKPSSGIMYNSEFDDNYLIDFERFLNDYNGLNFNNTVIINNDPDNTNKSAKIKIKPIDVLNELETTPNILSLTLIDEKINILKDKEKLIKQDYTKQEISTLIERLENRKKYSEFKNFFEKFQNTTRDKIDILLNKYELVMKTADIFIPEFPNDAIKIMTDYTENVEKLCNKKPIFFVIATSENFKDMDNKRDPILLVQSPFGFYYQILGAWDKEMLLLSEL